MKFTTYGSPAQETFKKALARLSKEELREEIMLLWERNLETRTALEERVFGNKTGEEATITGDRNLVTEGGVPDDGKDIHGIAVSGAPSMPLTAPILEREPVEGDIRAVHFIIGGKLHVRNYRFSKRKAEESSLVPTAGKSIPSGMENLIS